MARQIDAGIDIAARSPATIAATAVLEQISLYLNREDSQQFVNERGYRH
jgi:hypothetical protein